MTTFDWLPLTSKIRILKLAAEPITDIEYKNCTVTLYRVDRFLVEKYVDSETKKIVKIGSVQYMDLIKYLPHIGISSLYKLI